MSASAPTPAFAFAPIPTPTTPPTPIPEEEEYYSSWSLFLVCVLLILSLWTSYYLQLRRIRAVHETLVAIAAGSVVGLVVRLAPGTMIREMLVSALGVRCVWGGGVGVGGLWASADDDVLVDVQAYAVL